MFVSLISLTLSMQLDRRLLTFKWLKAFVLFKDAHDDVIVVFKFVCDIENTILLRSKKLTEKWQYLFPLLTLILIPTIKKRKEGSVVMFKVMCDPQAQAPADTACALWSCALNWWYCVVMLLWSWLMIDFICRSWNAGLKIMTIAKNSKYAIQQREIDKEFLWSKHNKVRISLQLLPSTRGKEPRITRWYH